MPVILAIWEAEIRKIKVQGQPGKIVRETTPPPISKISGAKWTGGVVQGVEHLLCKHEALHSNPAKKKKRKCKKGWEHGSSSQASA
jgi:hypothetical protein